MYIRITGRAILNIHTANAEGAVGNYISLSKAYVIRRTENGFEYFEEPVISGNMLKHWHAVETVNILKSEGYDKLCEYCKRYVMFRSPLSYNDEFEYISKCAIEDIHGFLATSTNIRRESIIRFSFMIPVEDVTSKYVAVTHNRIGITEKGKIDENVMMVFKREYATGIYGFSVSMDIDYIGRSQSNPGKVLNINERKVRAKAAIRALSNILSGNFGASRARAEPIIRVVELIALVSKTPIPNPTHAYYYDYIESNKSKVEILKKVYSDFKVYVIGDRIENEFDTLAIKCKDIVELAEKLVGDVELWLT